MPGKILKADLYISPEDMDDDVQYWDIYECEEEMAPERLDDQGEDTRIIFSSRDLQIWQVW